MVKVGRTVLPVVVESLSACFFADLRTDPAVIASVDCIYSREYVVAVVEKFYHAFARVTWIKLADEDTLNAFLD